MILIQQGIMTIPEEERYVGFAGDNLCSSRTFRIEGAPERADVYKLFLTFDNAACNYFALEKSDDDGVTTLLWDIRTEHILKPGIVRAQIKGYFSTGEIWHTSTDWFVVGDSAEFSDYFSDKENSEFLAYERRLLALKSEIEELLSQLPYFGEDGYWYVYSHSSGTFRRMADISAVMGLAGSIDVNRVGDVPAGQLFRCQGSIALKTGESASDYEELARWSNTCPAARRVAGLPLTEDISVAQLKSALGIG